MGHSSPQMKVVILEPRLEQQLRGSGYNLLPLSAVPEAKPDWRRCLKIRDVPLTEVLERRSKQEFITRPGPEQNRSHKMHQKGDTCSDLAKYKRALGVVSAAPTNRASTRHGRYLKGSVIRSLITFIMAALSLY